MSSPFDTAILKLGELGFFKFILPFMLSAAIFYGLLRKTQLFGPPEKNVAVNATVAVVASFFVWSWPILLGIDIQEYFANFFMQGLVVSIVAMLGLIVAGMFLPPDLPKMIGEKFKSGRGIGALIVICIIIFIIILLSSGLYKVFTNNINFNISSDVLTTIGVIVLLLGAVAAIVWAAR